jgi:hypothetical protein
MPDGSLLSDRRGETICPGGCGAELAAEFPRAARSPFDTGKSRLPPYRIATTSTLMIGPDHVRSTAARSFLLAASLYTHLIIIVTQFG